MSSSQPSLKTHPLRRHALAWAAVGALVSPAAQALDVFTGNAPVYMGSWFNGSFTEVVEFQFATDWAGWCGARFGSNCQATRYWNVAGNWDTGIIPGASSDVRVEIGDTVRIGYFDSIYRGPISGIADAGVLSAAGRVELYGLLRVGNATFADLYNDRDNGGTLETTGLATISLLSSGAGRFQGLGGRTRVEAFAPSPFNAVFEPLVRGGHTLEFSGSSSSTGVAVRLEPGARFVNSGTLGLAGGSVSLQGTATFAELPVFVNQGTLQGSGVVSGLKFENQGVVQVASGQAMAIANWGEHSGSFSGASGSTMSFTGIGSAGHRFAAGSRVNSLGAVNFGAGNHRVAGEFAAGSSTLNTFATLSFEGPSTQIGSFTLGGGGTVALRTPAGVSIQNLSIEHDFSRFDVDSGTSLDLQRLRLVLGSFNANAPVSIDTQVEWSSGWLVGSGPVTVSGAWQLLAGDRGFRGQVSNSGHLSWEGGRFTEWSGRFVHQAGAQFDILGDFSSAGGAGGKLINSGTVSKLGGAGRSELAMSFDSIGGTLRSLSGTLALNGGGTYTDTTFTAGAGAAIELSGGTSFGGTITTSGPLHLSGGDFTLLGGTAYTHAAGNRFEVANLRINSGARLSVVDAVTTSGSVTNQGTFTPASHLSIFGDFSQQGSFALNVGRSLFVAGTFDNQAPLTVSDAEIRVGTLVNRSTLNVVGSAQFHANSLDNRGTLVLGPASGFPGVSARIGGGINSGTLRVDGANVGVSSYDLQNTGLISNEGSWDASGYFTHHTGGRLNNAGTLNLNGGNGLFDTASIYNSGTLTLQDGVLDINVGTRISGPGWFVQEAGLTRVHGLLQAGGGIEILGGVLKGTGTVEGTVYVGPAGQWKPGTSPGTMTVTGDAFLSGGLELEVESSTVFDRLAVSGSFVAGSGSMIDVVFSAGYVPRELDADSIDWLIGAASRSVDRASVSFSGLPSNWSGTMQADGRIDLNNVLALQIATRGSHTVNVSGVHFNALGSTSADYPLLDRLDNAGYFHNRVGAVAYVELLNNEAGATLLNRGELGARVLDNAGTLNNRSGGSLSVATLNNSGNLLNQGHLDITNDFVNLEEALLEQRGTMRVGDLVTNRGRMVVAGPLSGMIVFNNSGDVHIEAGGSIEGRAGSWFSHSAGELQVDGLLAADDIRIVGGRLSGNGRLQGALTTFADIGPGGSVGLLTVEGILSANGNVDLEIAGAGDHDRLLVLGDAAFNGSLRFLLLGDYRPGLGDSFSLLSVAGAASYTDNWRFEREDGFGGWVLWADASGFYDPAVPADWRAGFANGTVSITAVPEPDSWALLVAGLGAVVWLTRRRQPASGAPRQA